MFVYSTKASVINWMLDVEDVACTVDDIESTDRLGCLVQRGWSEGRGDKCTRAKDPCSRAQGE